MREVVLDVTDSSAAGPEAEVRWAGGMPRSSSYQVYSQWFGWGSLSLPPSPHEVWDLNPGF